MNKNRHAVNVNHHTSYTNSYTLHITAAIKMQALRFYMVIAPRLLYTP